MMEKEFKNKWLLPKQDLFMYQGIMNNLTNRYLFISFVVGFCLGIFRIVNNTLGIILSLAVFLFLSGNLLYEEYKLKKKFNIKRSIW